MTHRIGVVGVNWRHRRPDLVSAMTIAREHRAARLPALRDALGVDELVYLATCGRVEVAFACDAEPPFDAIRVCLVAALAGDGAGPGAAGALRAWRDEGAVEHLFLVTSGLDSARLGESEVAGQVRDAVEQAHAAGTCGPRLHRVFDEAFRAARRVRQSTDGRAATSLADLAAAHALRRVTRTGGAVAVVGVSPMTETCAARLAARGVPIVIVNRTPANAAPLAARVQGVVRALDEFRASPDQVEAMIVATGATAPVFGRADLERLAARTPSGEPPLVVDLGVPANVPASVARAADVPRVGIEEIGAEAELERGRARLEFADARAAVDEALQEFRRHEAERMAGELIARLRLVYRHTAMEGVDRLFARTLPGLDARDRAAVRRWAETLASRMAHVPTVGLRELAVDLGPAALEPFVQAASAFRRTRTGVAS